MSRPPAKCGTSSGYNRHRRLREPACAACLQASTDQSRASQLRARLNFQVTVPEALELLGLPRDRVRLAQEHGGDQT